MMCQSSGVCARCKGAQIVVVGILVLANLFFLAWEWPLFIAVLLIVGGVLKIVMPGCGHGSFSCAGACCGREEKSAPARASKKKKA